MHKTEKKRLTYLNPHKKCELLVMLCVRYQCRCRQLGHETNDGACFGFWAGFVWGTWC